MDENLNPDFSKLTSFQAAEPTSGSGSSVSKPMGSRAGYGGAEKEVIVEEVKTPHK